LKAQWEDIEKKANSSSTSAPSLLYGEPDLTVRVIRDIFNEDFNKMLVQGDTAWDDIQNYIGHIAPELASKIEKWSGPRDIFAESRVEEQLAKAFDRKVYLPSGGSLVIDRTEAMIVIDVNTGKFIGKGGNLEETVTKNNLEAAEEIARQLRLRDMGGIIVIDFIDMTLESNRELVLRRLVECLGRDRTKHQVAEVTSLGLVQMTRKRVGQGLIEAFSTTCESCGGRGIHIHAEPVNKVALEKDMDQRFSQTSKANKSVAEDESSDDHESDQEESEDIVETPKSEVVIETGRRKGRRAVSTGVISTN
jgi:Rne/Rng family ribonuclease